MYDWDRQIYAQLSAIVTTVISANWKTHHVFQGGVMLHKYTIVSRPSHVYKNDIFGGVVIRLAQRSTPGCTASNYNIRQRQCVYDARSCCVCY